MNTTPLHQRLSPEEYAALIDAAHARAVQLRSEAIQAFVHRVMRGLRSGWQSLRRHEPLSTAPLHSRT